MDKDARSFHYRHDGLDLHVRLHGEIGGGPLPLVCLPGLTRNARDFEAFAAAVRRGPLPRPVVAFDYRGRGRSDWVTDPKQYTLAHELGDVLAGLDALGLGRAVFVGTSRGALLTLLMALADPGRIAAAVLNDAGPRLEPEGLVAIKAYVGKAGHLPDWPAAQALMRRINAPTFPALGDADFLRMARASFTETRQGIVADHDPRLADTLKDFDPAQPLPELWDAFAALRGMPVLAVRGEHSALLSRRTVARMAAEHPQFDAVEVPGQGHAPLLETAGLPERIAAFAAAVEEPT